MTTPIDDWAISWMNTLETLSQNFTWAITGDEAIRVGHVFSFGTPSHDNDNNKPKRIA